MSLCKGLNLTLIIKTIKMKGIIDIEGNHLKGQFGDLMDSLIENVDHSKRDCKLVGAMEFGDKLPNGSYTGVLRMLQEKTGDLYLSPSPQFFYTDFIDQTTAVLTARLVAAQRIEKDRKANEFDIVALIWNLDLNTKVFVTLYSLLFVAMLILLAYLFIGRLIIRKLIDNFFQFKHDFRQPVTMIGLVLIFYHLFFMIFKLLISSQISTSMVIVDTSWIINSMERLMATDSVVCWLKNDVEIRMAEQSPKQSSLYKVYKEKIYDTPVLDMEGEPSRHCLLSLKSIGQSFDMKGKLLFVEEASLYGFLTSFVAPNPSIAYWVGETPLVETISVYYIRRELTRHQKLSIDLSNYWKTQSGISARSYDEILFTTKKMITESSKIYNDLNAYIEDNTIFTNVHLSFLGRYLWMMLAAYALFVLALLLDLSISNCCKARRPRKGHVFPLPPLRF